MKRQDTVKTLTGAKPRTGAVQEPSESFQKQGERNRLEDKLPFATQ